MAGSKKILIIEDDQFISDMYASLLLKHGYKVDFATNGKDGLASAKATRYDLILLDIMMPEMTGIDVLKELRGEDGLGQNQTKIVILTNLGQNKASQDALKAKADGYLIKADVIPSKLLEIVNRLLDEK